MKNFNHLLKTLQEAQSLKGARKLLNDFVGVSHVDLPHYITKKFLKIVEEENKCFSNEYLYEDVHYGALKPSYFWVDSNDFHHCDPEEAHACMVLKAAFVHWYYQYKNNCFPNMWKTIEEQEAEKAAEKAEYAKFRALYYGSKIKED